MRLGQTSAIQFTSKLFISALGFLGTLYFARILGAEVLGTYFLLLSSMTWMSVVVQGGIGQSMAKRMSEGEHPADYFQIGGLVTLSTLAAIVAILLAMSSSITRYIGHPESTRFLVALVTASAFISVMNAGFIGTRKVHIDGILKSFESVLRLTLQVVAVTVGLGLTGLVFGWVAATLLISIIGTSYLAFSVEGFPVKPTIDMWPKLIKLFNYGKYSWFSSIKSKTNYYADIVILGLFVPNGLIGIYAISWNIASFLSIFGASISQTLFPEISRLAADQNTREVRELVRISIQFTGMFVIPGLFGGILLGERILRLYGDAFTTGISVLPLLIIAVLFYDYQKQLTNTLSGMDRPEMAFRVNVVFIGSNIILNFVLIHTIGYIGAAIAMVVSSGMGLVYSYRIMTEILEVNLPIGEIGKQVGASLFMSGVVLIILFVENTTKLVNNNFVSVIMIILIGAVTYLAVLTLISHETRDTIRDNFNLQGVVGK